MTLRSHGLLPLEPPLKLPPLKLPPLKVPPLNEPPLKLPPLNEPPLRLPPDNEPELGPVCEPPDWVPPQVLHSQTLFTHIPHFMLFMHMNVQACSLGMPGTQPLVPEDVDMVPDMVLVDDAGL